MFYLCLAFSLLWLINFIYLFFLDRQVKDIGRRLDTRTESPQQQRYSFTEPFTTSPICLISLYFLSFKYKQSGFFCLFGQPGSCEIRENQGNEMNRSALIRFVVMIMFVPICVFAQARAHKNIPLHHFQLSCDTSDASDFNWYSFWGAGYSLLLQYLQVELRIFSPSLAFVSPQKLSKKKTCSIIQRVYQKAFRKRLA